MTHSHEDRVAGQDPRQCCAYGCPMPGSMSSSTTGTSEWQCWLHFGANPGNWQRITADLHRMAWLVHTVITLRRDYGTKLWADTYRDAAQAIRAAQRTDLLYARDEKLSEWFMRLDAALRASCMPHEEARPARQQTLMSELQDNGTFAKVGFAMPEQAVA